MRAASYYNWLQQQHPVFGIEAALKLIADPNASTEDVETPVDLIAAAELKN